jgi:hypothetical protein
MRRAFIVCTVGLLFALTLRQMPPPRANIIGHIIGHVDITAMSAVLGGGRAGGKAHI